MCNFAQFMLTLVTAVCFALLCDVHFELVFKKFKNSYTGNDIFRVIFFISHFVKLFHLFSCLLASFVLLRTMQDMGFHKP